MTQEIRPKPRLFLTGASGLLGRAIFTTFSSSDWEVYGTALTRIGPGLHKVDLTKADKVEKALAEFKPTFVIHCAAQRYPDKVDRDHDAAQNINVTATASLSKLSKAIGAPMLYISTDYVFDGKAPPYLVDDKPNPLNMYGKTKLLGEEATLQLNKEEQAGNMVLRIPVLYGAVEQLSESAVTVLLELLMDHSKTHEVSHYERRRPSHVEDIAVITRFLATSRLKNPELHGIFQWCGREVFTKYEMIQVMADVFKLPCDHIKPTTEIPGSSTARPYDTTLDTSRIEEMFDVGTCFLPFKEHIYTSLLPWVQKLGV